MKIYTLSQRQARILKEARDTKGGKYIPISSEGDMMEELIEGGCADRREEKQSGGTRSATDPRPCEWTDTYLVPNSYGLELLRKHEAIG